MTERDAFEVRLGEGVHAYVGGISSDLDPAGFAHRIATTEPRRPERVAAFGRRGPAIPRLAWSLLLLAALLAALVGGLLMVGSQPIPRLPAVIPPVGQVALCPPGSTPDKPGPADQVRPLEVGERSGMAFDRQAGRLVAVASAGSAVETWTFDVCTNTWAQMHPKQEPSSFRWADLVYDIDSRATILFSIDTDWADPGSGSSADPGSVWSYDLRADTWTKKGAAPTINPVSLAYDSVSGLVVAAEHSDRKLMWTYDVEADTWTPFPWANGPDDPVVIAYDASVDRIVAYGDERFTDDRAAERIYETWLLDMRAGTWSRSTAERPAVVGWLVAPGIVFDEAAERTVIYRRGPLTAYDAAADRWEILEAAEDDTPVKGTLMVYDSVNRRLVGWGHDTWGPTGAVAARDLLTGEWTVLLAPDEGQPAQP